MCFSYLQDVEGIVKGRLNVVNCLLMAFMSFHVLIPTITWVLMIVYVTTFHPSNVRLYRSFIVTTFRWQKGHREKKNTLSHQHVPLLLLVTREGKTKLSGRRVMIDCRGTNPVRTDTHFLSLVKVTSGVKKTNQPHKPLQARREGLGSWARDCLWTQQSCEAHNSD